MENLPSTKLHSRIWKFFNRLASLSGHGQRKMTAMWAGGIVGAQLSCASDCYIPRAHVRNCRMILLSTESPISPNKLVDETLGECTVLNMYKYTICECTDGVLI